VRRQRELVETERQAEISESEALLAGRSARQLEALGLAIRSLRVAAMRTGLSGRCLVKLCRPTDELPATRIGIGDVVSLRPHSSGEAGGAAASSSSSGIVTKMRGGSVTVAFDEAPLGMAGGESASAWWTQHCLVLSRLANDVTYQRMVAALNQIAARPATLTPMHRALLGTGLLHGPQLSTQDGPTTSSTTTTTEGGLNREQNDAVRFALSTVDVALIQGPPGTGKTTTVADLIRRIVLERGERVLACAPSNVAVDNLAEKLCASLGAKRLVRIGHPARVMPSVTGMSLDSRVSHHMDADVIRDLRHDIVRIRNELGKRGLDGSARREKRAELAELTKDLRQRESRILQSVLGSAAVVLATCTGAGDAVLDGHPPFDWVVIDEAAQAMEAACWIPLLRGSGRCVLAGDDKQLPPTIKSEKAASAGLAVTLFERLHKKHGDRITTMLKVQYRMNEAIMQWASDALYSSSLIADPSVAHHLLCQLPGVADVPSGLTQSPLLIVDTAGCGFGESCESHDEAQALGSESKLNEGEAGIVA